MRKANVRIEAKRLSPNASRAERDKSLAILLRIFKRACNEAGIMHSLKEHESFIRKTDIKRRKKMMKLRGAAEALEAEKEANNPNAKKKNSNNNNNNRGY